jgi:hypothetical protein
MGNGLGDIVVQDKKSQQSILDLELNAANTLMTGSCRVQVSDTTTGQEAQGLGLASRNIILDSMIQRRRCLIAIY